MKLKISRVILVSILVAMTASLTSCGSSKLDGFLKNGDYVSAIEMLAEKLTKKPENKDNADMFASIYPTALEQRIPDQNVGEVIDTYLAPYGSTELAALKEIAKETNGTLLSQHETVSVITRRSEQIIKNLGEIVRIQSAVAPMPSTIGNAKKGNVYHVKKFTDNFNGQYNDNKYSYAMFLYNMGEALYPGKSITEKKEILTYYKKSNDLVAGVGNIKNHGAEICYLVANDYEDLGAMESKKEAIAWYKDALSWNANYKDAQTRVYRLNYEIAMDLKRTAKTIPEMEVVLSYIDQAGNYNNAYEQKKAITYELAYMHKDEMTMDHYKKAGELFASLGNYENSANETKLYKYVIKLVGLNKTDKSGNVTLSLSDSTNTISRRLEESDAQYTYLDATVSGSTFDIYVADKDKPVSPGAMFEGNTIANNKYELYTDGTRAPLYFYLTSAKGVDLGSGTLTAPGTRNSTSEIQNLAYSYKSKLSTPDVTYEFTPVYNKDDLLVALGNGYNKNKTSFSSSLFNKNVVLVKVTQIYYKADIGSPELPFLFFDENYSIPNPDYLRSVSPYYVSSVNYGRQAYFVISSNLSQDSIIKDFKSFRPKDSKNSGSSARSVSSGIVSSWKNNKTTIQAYSNAEKSYSISSCEDIFTWLKASISPDDAEPISFKLRSLAGNEVACISESEKIKVLNPYYVEPSEDTGTTVNTPTTTTRPTTPKTVPTTPTTTTTITRPTTNRSVGGTTTTSNTGYEVQTNTSVTTARSDFENSFCIYGSNGVAYYPESHVGDVFTFEIPASTIEKVRFGTDVTAKKTYMIFYRGLTTDKNNMISVAKYVGTAQQLKVNNISDTTQYTYSVIIKKK